MPEQKKVLQSLASQFPSTCKVIIIGQDPYPKEELATGIAFGVPEDTKILPTSLKILLRELQVDYPFKSLEDFDITLNHWCNQGVILLNSSLTCAEGVPGSHASCWKVFMEQLISVISEFKVTLPYFQSLVFVLIGNQAKALRPFINENWHYVMERSHPAAEGHGGPKFNGFFREVNELLTKTNTTEIEW